MVKTVKDLPPDQPGANHKPHYLGWIGVQHNPEVFIDRKLETWLYRHMLYGRFKRKVSNFWVYNWYYKKRHRECWQKGPRSWHGIDPKFRPWQNRSNKRSGE